jgi:hypothetical protein
MFPQKRKTFTETPVVTSSRGGRHVTRRCFTQLFGAITTFPEAYGNPISHWSTWSYERLHQHLELK